MNVRLMLLCALIPWFAFGAADFYRVAWRGDPATSAVICWNQVSGEGAEVCYDVVDHGDDADAYQWKMAPTSVLDYREMNNHFARLEGLEPDTAYYFVIRDSEGVGRRLWFKTASDKPAPFTFISGGDSRTNPEPRREGNKMVAKLRPLFVLFGGDYSGKGTAAQWAEWFSDWQLTIAEDGRIFPIIATHGNHENADMQMMSKLFDTPHRDQYYAYSVGGDMARIWVLNSELEYKDEAKVSAQNEWIRQDLPAHPDVTWKIVAYHRPMRAHTSHKAEGLNRIKWWAELFYENGVDVVVESDTHMVKQSYPVRPSEEVGSYESFIRDDEKGFVFIGEGSWGAPKRPANDDKPWTMASDSFYQFKWVQVHPDEMLIRTVCFDEADDIDAVVPLTEDNLFEEPEGARFWEPESGKVLRLPFDPNHSTYVAPAKPRTLVEKGAVWAWSVDGEVWADGAAPLGYGDKQVVTPVADEGDKPISAMFRKEFAVEDVAAVSRLFFDVLADDGYVILLNGEEVARGNLPEGELMPDTLALKKVSGAAEKNYEPVPIDVANLKSGVNVIEARAHQQSRGSSDLIFDLAVRVKE